MPQPPPNPQVHDRLFKCLLEEISIARDLLERYLPPSTLNAIDLSQLTLVMPEGFLLFANKLIPDVVFLSALTFSQEPIYILLEHQSSFDPNMTQRLLQYFFMLSQKTPPSATKGQLIPVVALVFYHGLETGFPEVIELQSLSSQHAIPFQVIAPNIQIPVINYQTLPWHKIPTNRPASMLECCLKARIDPQWLFIQKAMHHLIQHGNLSAKTMQEIQQYLFRQIEVHQVNPELFYHITQLSNSIPTGEIKMGTFADWVANNSFEYIKEQWVKVALEKKIQEEMEKTLQQGKEEGLQQGKLIERQTLAARLFAKGCSVQQIAEITGYDVDTIQEILNKA